MADFVLFRLLTIAAFVVITGSVLWTGVLTDSSGTLDPDAGSITYVAAAVGAAVLFAYFDEARGSVRKNDRKRRY